MAERELGAAVADERQSPAPDGIPAGTTFVVYWCPRCKVQSSKMHHFCERGHPMYPQTDIETRCLEAVLVFEESARA